MISITKKNETYLHIDADTSIMLELNDFFTFKVPGYQFTPQYRAKLWDGNIRLLNIYTKELYVGLLPYVKDFCKQNNYEFVNKCKFVRDNIDDVAKFIDDMQFFSKGEEIGIREYQRDAVLEAVKQTRTVLLSPTGSGKSLIIYTLMRWNQTKNRKQLIIVPTTSLVEQLYGDFADYAGETGWKVSENCSRIYSGKEKVNDVPVVISTWQSIYKLPKTFFENFDVIYGDEAHLFKSKSLTSILHKCVNAPFRIGTTGTLDGTQTHRLVLEGLFGVTHKVTTTKKLMDSSQLAELKIVCLLLQYSDEDKKNCKKFTYQEEIDWIISNERRNKFIRNLVIDQKGNTLVLFNYVEKHGKILHAMIQEKAKEGRKVFFVHGAVETSDREEIRAITENESDAIIVASSGTFSTGINIRNLHNIVFASPTKSRVRNLQSIGRGLRLGENKFSCKLFDIADDLSWKSHKNHTLNHLIARVKIYSEESFQYKLINVPIYER
jgi:superfamily II DNA or RNA helicase